MWWLWGSVGALFLSGIGAFALVRGGMVSAGWLTPYDFPSVKVFVLVGVVMGPIFGAVTGVVMVRLLRQRGPHHDYGAARQARGGNHGRCPNGLGQPPRHRLPHTDVQVVFFAINEGWLPIAASEVMRQWSVALASARVTVIPMGLAVFDTVLARAGDAVSARVALVAYGLGAGAWIVVPDPRVCRPAGELSDRGQRRFGAGLCDGRAAHQRAAPLGGWVAIALSGFRLIRFAFPHNTFTPYMHHPVLVLHGVLLLLRGGRPRPLTTSSR